MEGGLHCSQRLVGIDSLKTCPSVQDQRRLAGAESYFCCIYTTDCSPVNGSVWRYGSYVLCSVRVRDKWEINRIAWNIVSAL